MEGEDGRVGVVADVDHRRFPGRLPGEGDRQGRGDGLDLGEEGVFEGSFAVSWPADDQFDRQDAQTGIFVGADIVSAVVRSGLSVDVKIEYLQCIQPCQEPLHGYYWWRF